MILVVAATARELEDVVGAETLVCGIGPVESALATAAALATATPRALLHIGIAGAQTLEPPALVLGSEAVYADVRDVSSTFPRIDRVEPDPALLAAVRDLLPDAHVLPIATSGRVGGGAVCEVEAMEGFGVLRAAALAGVPALEIRAVSNAVGEPDRTLWRIAEALAVLATSIQTVIEGSVPELPPPLPPETRTVGQVIAETIRAYGENFWVVLPLGLPLALADQARIRETAVVQAGVLWACTPLFALAFVRACSVLHGRRATWTAFWLAVVIWLPFPALNRFFILPALAWLAFIGMAVPAAMVEGLGFRDALARGRQLGSADFAHALGSLAALVIVIGVADLTLSELLHSQSDTGQRAAVFAADLVLSPLLFLGGALLYLDQAARVGSRQARLESKPKER